MPGSALCRAWSTVITVDLQTSGSHQAAVYFWYAIYDEQPKAGPQGAARGQVGNGERQGA